MEHFATNRTMLASHYTSDSGVEHLCTNCFPGSSILSALAGCLTAKGTYLYAAPLTEMDLWSFFEANVYFFLSIVFGFKYWIDVSRLLPL